jgi:antitoxin (DNA-binding transcriptional repressor) of toxin-antitoxin stability system
MGRSPDDFSPPAVPGNPDAPYFRKRADVYLDPGDERNEDGCSDQTAQPRAIYNRFTLNADLEALMGHGARIMQTVTVEEAQRCLAEIIDKLTPGEAVVLLRDNRPVARLVAERKTPRPGLGLGKGLITIVSDDEEHLKDFAEYMP